MWCNFCAFKGVMPGGHRGVWRQSAGPHRNELIHTIGNLSLLNRKLNPVQSNKAWVVEGDPDNGKREALEDHSVLYLNKRLCEHDSWNAARIKERSGELFENAKKI
jgi:hypothetical protein